MNLKEKDASYALRLSGEIDPTEQVFRRNLTNYQRFYSNDTTIRERILLDPEELEAFNQFNLRYSMNQGIITFDSKALEYYLEKNFILNRYVGKYHYITLSSINHLLHHYQLLLTRNFEDIPLSLKTNTSLKPYLVDLYLDTMRNNDDLVETIIAKHPEKVAEVASLLTDYNAYQQGLVRPEELLVKEQINTPFTGPYVLKKEVSTKK